MALINIRNLYIQKFVIVSLINIGDLYLERTPRHIP